MAGHNGLWRRSETLGAPPGQRGGRICVNLTEVGS